MKKFFSILIGAWFLIDILASLIVLIIFDNHDLAYRCDAGSYSVVLSHVKHVTLFWSRNTSQNCLLAAISICAWLIGVISVPIFLVPMIYRISFNKRDALRILKNDRVAMGRTSHQRAQYRLMLLMLVACCAYYVYAGYFSEKGILVGSAAGAAINFLGISFGPAGGILLTCALAIDLWSVRASRTQGA